MADEDKRHGMEEVPRQRPDVNDWPKGVRKIGMDELDCLGIDKHGGFYWQGKQVNVKHIVLTFGQKMYALVGITAAALVAMRGGSGNLHSGDKWNFCLTSA
ncbi:hypothetical protein [Neorhizobium sp. IRS_2294]|uniref:hypothetical protein n=1 Tax=unclassified Neorhizobium TaxID=2629175 RepID=UPI003D2A04B7